MGVLLAVETLFNGYHCIAVWAETLQLRIRGATVRSTHYKHENM